MIKFFSKMTIFNLIFPKKCLGCGETGSYFCPDCLNLVSLEPRRICPICLRPSRTGLTHFGCQTPYGLDGLTSIFAYRGVIKKAIKKLKYQFISDLAQDLTEVFLSFCGEDRTFTRRVKKAVLIPMPLHPSRKRWRGFSQTELLGKMITHNLGIEFLPKALKRTKKTKPQKELSRKERKKDVQGAFQLSPCFSPTSFPKVLLFDDVWVWGESLREATKVLKENGAKQVWGLTVARKVKNWYN